MLFHIGRGASGSPDDPGAHLLACHERIRRFTALAVRLGAIETAPANELTDAARAVIRYFREALPLHSQDEDDSVLPRLAALDAARAPLDEMHAQHAAIHAAVDALCEVLEELVATPAAHPALRGVIGERAAATGALFDEHLALEEAHIFPRLAELDAADRAAIVAEMRARRADLGAVDLGPELDPSPSTGS